MFFGINSARSGGNSNALLDAFEGFTGETQRFIGVGEAVEREEPVDNGSFGAIASYQVCACCARFHGPASAADGGGGPTFGLNADDRGVFGPNGKPSLSSTDAGAQITRTNQSWSSALGTAAVVTYAFRDSVTTMPTDTAGFSQFNATQIAATVLALSAWSDVANITFQRVQEAGIEFSNNATILLGNYSSGQDGAAAFAYLPGGTPGATGFSQVQGDVWINSSLSYNALPVQQGYGQLTLLHELGHAIGLSHPAAYNASSGGVITYSGSAIYYEDSLQYSVMSYFSERETGADFRTDGTGVRRYSAAPLLDDISAAQRLYGANMTTRTGDTVYGFNSNAGQLWYTAGNELSALVFCAWDAGGTDTFDFSGYLNNGQIIDLRQGCFSSVGGLVGNVSIALGAVIENAIGGSGSDTFRGNSANNRFTPNTGTDVVDGGLGTDTVVFSGARSAYTVTWSGQTGTVTGNGQNVTVTNVEFLQFTDQTIAAAPTGGVVVGGDITSETITGTALADVIGGLGGDDVINGLAGSDTLNGGSGNDTLNGGDDNDMLIGALGNDTLNGGAGIDTADYSGAGAAVTVNLSAGTASGGAGSDTLSLVENVTGTTFADTLTGDGAANVLRGGGGVDTLSGGGGADELYAGAPGLAGGAPDIIKGSDTTNGSIGTAVSLTGSFDLAENAAIANSTTIPHATVVATTHGNVEYYRVTVTAGETVNFDIDNATFDSTLRLFDNAGVELASNDDNGSDGGESTDSALSHTFATAGTYYIQVGRWVSGSAPFVSGPPPANQTYTLHVSSPSQPTTPIVLLGSTLNGDAGADLLTGGTGADTLNGGADDDILNGAGGNDTINGGDGSDTAVFTGNRSAYTITVSGGVSTVVGPDGTDTVTNVERLQFADGLFDPAGAPLSTGGIDGTSNADTLNGTAGADVISGFGGDDVINGGAGNDTIDGGAGTDTAVFSGARAGYTVSTVGGTTTVTGPDGTDTLTTVERLQFADITLIVGAGGGQYFAGTSGADTITGTAFADEILAAAGDDTLTGAGGNDTIDGGAGTDTAVFSGARAGYTVSTVGGTTTVTGPDGTDTLTTVERLQFADITLIVGAGGGQYFAGTSGADTITGTAFADEILAAAGDDTLTGAGGNDTIDGGAGTDTAAFSGARAGYTVSTVGGVTTVTGPDGTDTLTTVERLQFADGLYGIDGNPLPITGTEGANALAGTGGADTISGLGGDDTITGGSGNDSINGGDGVDTAVFSGSMQASTVSTTGGTTTVVGPDGTDTLTGVEYLRFDNGTLIVGAGGGQLFEGTAGDDGIVGTAFADEIRGGAGNDFLNGGGGNDLMIGGLGDDRYLVDAAGDQVVEAAGEGSDRILASASYVLAAGVSVETLETASGSGFTAINLTGNELDNTIFGNSGVNQLSGGAGADTLTGATGNDTIDGGDGSDTAVFNGNRSAYTITVSGGVSTVVGPDGTDTVTNVELLQFADGLYDAAGAPVMGDPINGTSGADMLNGTSGAEVINGLDGNDVINAGTGNDTIDGGAGTDTAVFSGARAGYTVSTVGGTTTVTGPDGTDTLTTVERLQFADVTLIVGAGGGQYFAGTAGNDTITGTAFADEILGGLGADSLTGAGGNDAIDGGDGNDTLRGDGGNDTLIGGAGTDTADYSSAASGVTSQLNSGVSSNDGDGGSDTLSGVENLTGSAFNDVFIGSAGANVLLGGLGSDVLIGLAGDDTIHGGAGAANELYGGTGDDRYIVEAVGETIIEQAAEGLDLVETSLDRFRLGSNLENLTYTGSAFFVGEGNASENTLRGGTQRDVLLGYGSNDIILGGSGEANEVYGGTGDDYFVVEASDSIVEYVGEGLDTVDSRQSYYLLGANIENLIFGGSGNFVGIGNELGNFILGGAQRDILIGNAGNDVLHGGAGEANEVHGGTGDDYFVVEANDSVVEYVGEGVDTVDSRLNNYRLGANVENLVFGGTGNFTGVGNALDNYMLGGTGNDVLRGEGGNDSIFGGLGTDTVELSGSSADYTITAVTGGYRITDAVTGRDGTDWVYEVETLRFGDGSTVTLPAAAGAPVEMMSVVADDRSGSGPEVLPAMSDEMAKNGMHQVLPAASFEMVKDGVPEVLPGAEVLPASIRDMPVPVTHLGWDGDLAETLPLFGDFSVDDGYLVVGATDAGSPEVLPAIADDFILTAKFEGPPVLPTSDVEFDVAGLVKDIEFAQGLLFSGGGNSSNPNVSADGLTVYEDWSAFAAPTRHDVWG